MLNITPKQKQELENAILLVKKHKLSLLLFLVALSPLLAYLFLNFYYKAQSEYVLYSHQRQQNEDKNRQKQEYENLLQQQEKRGLNKNITQAETTRKAVGDYTLHIVLVKPPTIHNSDIAELIDKLKEKDSQNISSLYYLKTFYKKEAGRYGVSDFNLQLKFHGPYTLEKLEQVGDVGLFWSKDPFATTKLQDSFSKLLSEDSISLDDKSLVVFLYFDDSFNENTEDDSRFYEHKKFRSFADKNTGKSYINVYKLDKDFSKTVIEIVGHEVLHLFGASDKYEESESVTRVCSKKGRGDLDLRPRVPQKTADIMCMYIEKEDDKFVRGSFLKNTLVINSLTAAEIGWKARQSPDKD